MTQIATVEKILPGGMAEISVPRKSACGHDCEECAGCGVSVQACALSRATTPVRSGQKVVVESSTKNLLGVMLLVYLLPIVLFSCRLLCDRRARKRGTALRRRHRGVFSRHHPAIICDRRTKKNGKLTFTIVRLF